MENKDLSSTQQTSETKDNQEYKTVALDRIKQSILREIESRASQKKKGENSLNLIKISFRKKGMVHALANEITFRDVQENFEKVVTDLEKRAKSIFHTNDLVIEASIYPYFKKKHLLAGPFSLETPEDENLTEDGNEERKNIDLTRQSTALSLNAVFPRSKMTVSHLALARSFTGKNEELPKLDFSELEKSVTAEFLDSKIDYNFRKWGMLGSNNSLHKIRQLLTINGITTPRQLLSSLGTLNPTHQEWNEFILKVNRGGSVNQMPFLKRERFFLIKWLRQNNLLPAKFIDEDN